MVDYAGMWVMFGRRLMRCMMRTARLFGATMMTLEVRETNLGAQALYASLGFVQEGRRKGYYTDTGEDAFILWNHDIALTLADADDSMEQTE